MTYPGEYLYNYLFKSHFFSLSSFIFNFTIFCLLLFFLEGIFLHCFYGSCVFTASEMTGPEGSSALLSAKVIISCASLTPEPQTCVSNALGLCQPHDVPFGGLFNFSQRVLPGY